MTERPEPIYDNALPGVPLPGVPEYDVDDVDTEAIDPLPAATLTQKVDEQGEYQPRVPDWLRDVVYYAGLAAAAAVVIFPEYPVIVRIGGAVGIVASGLAKVYRAKTR